MHLTISMLIGAVLSWQLQLIFTCYSDTNSPHTNPDVRSVVSPHVRLPAVAPIQSYENNTVPDETTPRTDTTPGKMVCFWGRITCLVTHTPIKETWLLCFVRLCTSNTVTHWCSIVHVLKRSLRAPINSWCLTAALHSFHHHFKVLHWRPLFSHGAHVFYRHSQPMKLLFTSRLTKSRCIVTAHGMDISWSRNYATTQQLLKLRWRNLHCYVKQSF